MEMTSTTYNEHLEILIDERKISIEQIDNAVKRILLMKMKLGLFDNPYPHNRNESKILAEKHLAAAKQSAIESAVLLKNENSLLPISNTYKSIAVIGPLAHAPHEQMGTWSFDGKKEDSITPLTAIKNEFPQDVELNYAPGLAISRTRAHDGFADAIAVAQKSEIILFFVGEEAILSGEAHSRAHLNLPGAQEQLLDELEKTGKPIVMIVVAGRPLVLTNLLPKVDAVLYAWQGGTMAGPAIVDLLVGKANPSGKLPITFPRAVGQIPIYHAQKNTGRPSSASSWIPIDKIPVEAWQTSLGNTSHYLDEGFAPLFPFGFGLSYTKFDYQNLKLNQIKIALGESVEATVDITNTGDRDGYEVVQLYIQDIFGSVTRPIKELKGFQKIFIKSGETKTVRFGIGPEQLSFFDENTNFLVEPGDFKIWIGANSSINDNIILEITDKVPLEK